MYQTAGTINTPIRDRVEAKENVQGTYYTNHSGCYLDHQMEFQSLDSFCVYNFNMILSQGFIWR